MKPCVLSPGLEVSSLKSPSVLQVGGVAAFTILCWPVQWWPTLGSGAEEVRVVSRQPGYSGDVKFLFCFGVLGFEFRASQST
jgi:hypothetical protein